jgi:ATP-dependent RNA helicase DBP3
VSALQDVPDKPKKAKKSKTVPPAEDVPDASSSAPAEKEQNHKKSERAPAPSSDALAGAPSAAEVAAYLSTHAITLTLPDGAAPVTPALTFAQLSLPAELRGALGAFERPTPIQACTWPPALAGRDVVGIAETGSGKTLAFGLPALASLLAGGGSGGKKKKGKGQAAGGVAVLVLAPTRELALQTHETLDGAGTPLGITSVAVFGGVDKGAQVRALRAPGARVVVGTPGRIKDLVADGALDLSAVAFLVLDEADRMLDKGFENDIRTIIGYTVQGKARQTLMCMFCAPCGGWQLT